MRHCRVDHGHCHSQWKETKGLAVDSLLYHPFLDRWNRFRNPWRWEKMHASPEATGSTPHAPGERSEDQNLSKVVSLGPLEATYPTSTGFSSGIKGGRTSKAEALRRDSSRPSPSKMARKTKKDRRNGGSRLRGKVRV